MRKPVLMPDLGAAATLSVWFVKPGERIYAGDRLVEVLTGGATLDVSADAAGVFLEKKAWPDQPLTAGQVLGYLDESD